MKELRFDGRVAIVTGAGRGIGREHALLLARRGARVIVNNRSREGAMSVVEEITSSGGQATAHVAGIETRAGAESLIAAALDAYGQVDILVNNAGILNFCEFQNIDDELRDEMFNTHLTGAWVACQAAWPHMMKQRYGRIIMTVSSAGLWGMPNNAHYCAAKGAMLGLAKGLANEGAPFGIRVNSLAVGGATRMTKTRIQDPVYLSWAERVLHPSAASPPMAWLAHEDCPVNGEIFGACGQWMSRIVIGASHGYASADEYTAEAIRNNFDAVMSVEKLDFYANVAEHAAAIGKRLGAPVPLASSAELRSKDSDS